MSTKEELIRGLNEDLAAELGTIISFLHQEDELDGLMSNELGELFTREIEDELDHAAFLTEAIVDLDGEPTNSPSMSNRPTDLEEMLILDLKMEWQGVGNYIKQAKLAEELGDQELKRKLEEIADVKVGLTHELRLILRRLQRDSLKDLGSEDNPFA
jgi:bacterioferritin (cytochrome b1)